MNLIEYLDGVTDAMRRQLPVANERAALVDRQADAESRLAAAIEKSITIQAQRPPWAPPNYLPIGTGGPGGSGAGPGAPSGSAPAGPAPPSAPPVVIDLGKIDPRTGLESTMTLPNFAPAGMKMGGGGDSPSGDQAPSTAPRALPPVTIDSGMRDAQGAPIIDPVTGKVKGWNLPGFLDIGENRPGAGTYSSQGFPGEPRKSFGADPTPAVGRYGNDPRFPLIPSAPNPGTGSFGTGSTTSPKRATANEVTAGEKQIVDQLKRMGDRLAQIRDDGRSDPGGLALRRKGML